MALCLLMRGQAALNLDASVGRLGFYGEEREKLWCLSKMESLHLWQWQAACEEEAEGGHPIRVKLCIAFSIFQALD